MSSYKLPNTYTYPHTTGNISINVGGTGGGGTGFSTGTSYSVNNTWSNPPSTGQVIIAGDCEFKGNITWKGRDLKDWLESVESRLGMLQPNSRLEAEYEELKALSDQYRALEKRLLEQQRVFDILKNPLD